MADSGSQKRRIDAKVFTNERPMAQTKAGTDRNKERKTYRDKDKK